ncbi:hypothetical protein K438DRAFT_1962271 [Mycena galopus ATCC 62051]|nr:hypothetical protein K438DRAFT_1962271 [Mycena galopus ATCC 62051]
MDETVESEPTRNAKLEVDALDIAYKEALAITNRHKGRSNMWGVYAILGNYLAIAGCIAVSEYSCARLSSTAGCAMYFLMALIISSRLRAFEHLVHEASHNNLFTVPRAHEWFEFTYAFPVFRLLKVFRTLHLEHHKYLGDPVRDADVVRFIDYGFIGDTQMSAGRKTWLMFGLPFTGWFHYEYFNTLFTEFWMHPSCYPSKAIYWIVVLAAVHFFDNWVGFGWYYVIPWLGILPVTRWWAELGEHLGMDMTGHFGNSRTNDGFCQQWLRKAHAELMAESSAFREKNVVANSIWETFRQIYTRPTIIKEGVKGIFDGWTANFR